MHKIGGMAVQPQVQRDEELSPYPALEFDGRLDENDFPLSSQESVMTNASTDLMPRQRRGSPRKRSFSDEEDEDEDDVAQMAMPMEAVGPRRMARVRGARAWARDVKRTVSGEAEMDFGEAEWLVPIEGGERMEM